MEDDKSEPGVEQVADKPVQRVSLKERLENMKIKAVGNSMGKVVESDKGKEELLYRTNA